mmetsp:Transcript_29553/g.52803  ORF Transcript_29553/g.52803 Transcript_29553/m.52803 type:complete len:518 (-) Transcript_29553:231-1784(-)
MDIYSTRDFEVSDSDNFWQFGAIKQSFAQSFMFGGNLLQSTAKGGKKSDYYLLSAKHLIQCKGPNFTPHMWTSINWKRFEAFEDQSVHGFNLYSRGAVETFFTENVTEQQNWVDHLKKLCVLSGLEKAYVIREEIGAGAFSVVKKASDKSTRERVAIKLVDKSSTGAQAALKEVDLMRRCHHDGVLKVLGVYDTEKHIAIVLEYAKGGTLLQHIMASIRVEEEVAREAMIVLFGAIAHIHKTNCVHRDIKLDNILLKNPNDFLSLKLADFGLACDLEAESLGKRCGSAGYVAPEILLGRPHTNKIDVFSAGIILHIILSGVSPFRHPNERNVLKMNAKCEIDLESIYWQHISDPAKDFVKRCLSKEPLMRPTAEEALAHPWFVKLKPIAKQTPSIELTESDITESLRVTSSSISGAVQREEAKEPVGLLKLKPVKGNETPASPDVQIASKHTLRRMPPQTESAPNSPNVVGHPPREVNDQSVCIEKLPEYLQETKMILTPQFERRRYTTMRTLNILR